MYDLGHKTQDAMNLPDFGSKVAEANVGRIMSFEL